MRFITELGLILGTAIVMYGGVATFVAHSTNKEIESFYNSLNQSDAEILRRFDRGQDGVLHRDELSALLKEYSLSRINPATQPSSNPER